MELEDFNRDVATPILQEANSQLARLRAENERLQTAFDQAVFENSELKDQISSLRRPRPWAVCEIHGPEHPQQWGCPDCVAQMRTELTALRRPLEQSDAAEAVFKLMRPYDTLFLWNDPRLRELIQKWCEPLLSALDTNARQLRERVEMLSVVQDALSERNRECVELRERCGRLEGALQQQDCRCHYVDRPGSNMPVAPTPNTVEYLTKVTCTRCLALAASQQHTAGSGDGLTQRRQEETCRCAVTCLVAKGGKTLKLDGTPYKCKGLPATRASNGQENSPVTGRPLPNDEPWTLEDEKKWRQAVSGSGDGVAGD